MSQHPPAPPGVQTFDENSTPPEAPATPPDPLDNVKLGVSDWVGIAKVSSLFGTFACWNIDVVKTGLMGGKTLPASVSMCYSYKGLFPGVSSGILLAGINNYCWKTAEQKRYGSLASTGLALAPLLALPLLVPLEVTKRQCQFYQTGLMATRKAIMDKHGFRGLFIGHRPFIAMHGAYVTAFALPQLLPLEREVCWGIGGLLYMVTYLLTSPLDVLTNRAMLGQNKGTLLQDAKVLGVQGLAAGFGPRVAMLITILLVDGLIAPLLIKDSKQKRLLKERMAAKGGNISDPKPLEEYDTTGDDMADDELMEELLGKDKASQLKKKIAMEESEQSSALAVS